MNSSARQRFAQMMQQEQARQAQADMLSQIRGPRTAAPAQALTQPPRGQASQSSRMLGAVRMANGGPVGALPTIKELAGLNPPRRDAADTATAPFTQNNPIVPMFNLETPAFGGMEQGTYDWTAPSVSAGQFTQPDRMPPALTPSTSAYRPVDATTLPGGGANIPNVPVTPNQVLPPAQSPAMPPPAPMAPPAPVTGTGIPNVVTADDRQQRERDANELARQKAEEDRRRQVGIQAELERQERLAEQQRQAAIQAEAQRLEQEEAERQNALRIAREAEQRRLAQAQEQEQATAERRAQAREAADAAEKAERARQAEAIKNNRNNAMANFFTRGIRSKLGGGAGQPIYDPNKMVSVTRLVDGGQGGQYVEKIPQSQYDIEQARARAYKDAFGAE